MDREAWRAAIHGVEKSRAQLSNWTELNWIWLLCGSGKWYRWTYLQSRNRDTDMENKLVESKRRRKVRLNREIGIDIYTLCVCVVNCFCCVWLFVTLWTEAHHSPLSLGISRQEYWSGLPCLPPGDLPYPGIETASLNVSSISRRLLYCHCHLGSPIYTLLCINIIKQVTNENLLYSTSNLLSTLWWPKREGNLKKRGICIHVTDSLCCTVETSTL